GAAEAERIRRLGRVRGGRARFEAINVQLTRETALHPSRAVLVDFGQFVTQDRFDLPVLSLVHDRLLRWGAALRPGHPHFVQPHPALRVPDSIWGMVTVRASNGGTRLCSRVEPATEALAQRFRAGQIGGGEVLAAVEAMVAESVARWR